MKKPPAKSSVDHQREHEEAVTLEWLDEMGIGFEETKPKAEARDRRPEKAA